MSFAGQQFFNKAYKIAHPEFSFQHRGKGRYYILPAEDGTTAPNLEALRTFKAEKTTASTDQAEDAAVPTEPKPARKRRAAVDLDEQPVLKATRTRNGSARTDAIDVDAEAPDVPDAPDGASEQQEEPATAADDGDLQDEIPVAPAKSPPKTKAKAKAKGKGKAKAPPKKKATRAPPKARVDRNESKLLSLKAATTLSLFQDPKKKDEMDSDLEKMGSSPFPLIPPLEYLTSPFAHLQKTSPS